ncbi:uncharacterized protein MICPUCDRAFT_49662, partial [Micromonas pusilla CCMP1545]
RSRRPPNATLRQNGRRSAPRPHHRVQHQEARRQVLQHRTVSVLGHRLARRHELHDQGRDRARPRVGGDDRVHDRGPGDGQGRGEVLREVREERQRAAARGHADLQARQAPQGEADVQRSRRAGRQGGHDVHRAGLWQRGSG